jgi:hypothetical protein
LLLGAKPPSDDTPEQVNLTDCFQSADLAETGNPFPGKMPDKVKPTAMVTTPWPLEWLDGAKATLL